jgi:hypothetical protein
LAWRHGGEDPYRLYNGLDERYVPLLPDAEPEPLRPLYPSRVRMFIYACANVAEGEPVKSLAVKPRES